MHIVKADNSKWFLKSVENWWYFQIYTVPRFSKITKTSEFSCFVVGIFKFRSIVRSVNEKLNLMKNINCWNSAFISAGQKTVNFCAFLFLRASEASNTIQSRVQMIGYGKYPYDEPIYDQEMFEWNNTFCKYSCNDRLGVFKNRRLDSPRSVPSVPEGLPLSPEGCFWKVWRALPLDVFPISHNFKTTQNWFTRWLSTGTKRSCLQRTGTHKQVPSREKMCRISMAW